LGRRGALTVALVVTHTAHLDPAKLGSVRRLLDEAFGGGFDDADWEHALGGMHAVASDGDRGGRARLGGSAAHGAPRAGAAVVDEFERIVRAATTSGRSVSPTPGPRCTWPAAGSAGTGTRQR
jgi:hypothetical protein